MQFSNGNTGEEIYSLSNGLQHERVDGAIRAGSDGPLVLDDIHLIEQLQHFDRERIPERVVHANGGGAYGEFECTDDGSDLIDSCMFKKGYKCEVVTRFSSVGMETGGPDTIRDVRGFSVKFYTEEGNVDWVFNNTPVFFLRDPTKFPLFIHTQKRDPKTHLNHLMDSTNFWDYMSGNEESIHQVMYLFGDRGTPDGFRFMNGYSGHTFIFRNAEGECRYVQIHVKSDQGIKYHTEDEANKLAGTAPDYSKKDLYDAIQQGNYPSWTVSVQVMTYEQAKQFRYDVNDLTKIWPHAEFPLRKLGKITLNKNLTNYFAEMEQLAFAPSRTSRGMYFSNDPVLQSRTFSYVDTHHHRLGVNYQQLPVNQPKAIKHKLVNYNRDGMMAYYNQEDRPNFDSQLAPMKYGKNVSTVPTHDQRIGRSIRVISEVTPLDFEQPRQLWQKVFDDEAKKRFIYNVTSHLSRCTSKNIIKNQIKVFSKVDEKIGQRIATMMKKISPEEQEKDKPA